MIFAGTEKQRMQYIDSIYPCQAAAKAFLVASVTDCYGKNRLTDFESVMGRILKNSDIFHDISKHA